jgi:hypothetical protein
MEPGEALSTAAQIAVALAGFAGVVVAFREGSLREWAPIDKYRLWLLLANSATPLICCLFGILVLTVKPMPAWIWGWCSVFATLVQLPFLIINGRKLTQVKSDVVRDIGTYRYVFYGLAIAGTGVIVCQIVNAVFLNLFWIFFLGIAFQLAAAILQFTRMILLPPHTSKS